MIINHNALASNSYRQLSINNANTAKSTEKLASGLRINKAGDDAAGLAISEKMRGQIRGLDQASRNAQDGISMIQTAEGALNETHSILQRMRELSVQSSNDTNTTEDRENLQKEVAQLKSEIDRIGNTTEFNTQKLLDGSKGAKTTSASLTSGQAMAASATSPISIKDGVETANNSFSVTYDTGAATAIQLNVKVAEGSYSSPVDFTVAVEKAVKEAADAYDKANGGTAAATAFANLKLSFNVDSTDGSPTYGQVKYTFSNSDASKTFTLQGATATENDVFSKNLGFGAGSITVNAQSAGVDGTATAAAFSTNSAGTANAFDNFAVKIEDGIEPTANQNNQLKLTIDGLDLTASIAEGDYTSLNGGGSLSAAVQTAINSAIDTKVDSMTATDLTAKGYKGAVADQKTAYAADLKNGLTASYNTDGKLELNSHFEMKVDETSKGAQAIGMTNVNADIKNTGVDFQIGANANQTMKVDISDMRTTAIGKTTIDGTDKLLKDVDISTKEGAQAATKILDTAIKQVSQERSKLGAFQNRLEHTINNLNTSSENLTSAESRIRDTDMAKTVMENTKNGILAQAAQAMLAQANQAPQQVLQLLR